MDRLHAFHGASSIALMTVFAVAAHLDDEMAYLVVCLYVTCFPSPLRQYYLRRFRHLGLPSPQTQMLVGWLSISELDAQSECRTQGYVGTSRKVQFVVDGPATVEYDVVLPENGH